MGKLSFKLFQKSDRLFFGLLLIGTLILINIAGQYFFKRIDFTADKRYSLSKVSINKLKNLDDIVSIKAYFSSDLPPDFLSIRQEISDFLKDYQSYSRGKLKVEYFDPLKDPEIEKEALNYGLIRLQFSGIEKDKFQVQNGYLGLVILYEDRFKTMGAIDSISNLEYELTSSILEVLNNKKTNIALMEGNSGGQEETITDEFTFLRKIMQDQYQIVDLARQSQTAIQEEPDIIVVIADKKEFTGEQKLTIDQFIMKQKGVLILANGVTLDQGLSGSAAKHNLYDLLKTYGVVLQNNLVLDKSCDIASFQSGYSTFLTPYPYWVKVRKENFSGKNPITSKIETMTFQWPSALGIDKNFPKGAKYEILAKSGKESWQTDNIYDLSPKENYDQGTPISYKMSNLALFITGQLNSIGGATVSAQMTDSFISDQDKGLINQTEKAKIIVVSNVNFLKDNFLSRNQEGAVFFLNSIDYLNSDFDLMLIRSKTLFRQPILRVSDNFRLLIKIGNVVMPFFLLVIVWIGRKMFEQRKDRSIKNLI